MERGIGVSSGLEGVVVAETVLSDVGGEAGRLGMRGKTVEQLVEHGFESALWLLWSGRLPERAELDEVTARLGAGRARAFAALDPSDRALRFADGMDALRALVARLELDPAADGLDRFFALVGAVGTYVAAWQRVRRGGAPLAPDPSARHAGDLLQMATGAVADEAYARGLERYLVTVMDHGMNASTFAARVVTSTGSDEVSAIVAAIGALKGPLHGGAPGPVLDMLDAVGDAARARSWLENELREGRRVMGMGHRIYRVRDPRAAVLERAVEHLERKSSDAAATARLKLARAVEREAEELLRAKKPERPLRANVEFYTAVLLEAVGVDRAAFSPMFAAGRVAGWCAHIDEQRRTGRLIRPASRYVGPTPG